MGKLTSHHQYIYEGSKPRNFMIDPTIKYILVANQETDNMVIFKRNAQNGTLTPTEQEI